MFALCVCRIFALFSRVLFLSARYVTPPPPQSPCNSPLGICSVDTRGLLLLENLSFEKVLLLVQSELKVFDDAAITKDLFAQLLSASQGLQNYVNPLGVWIPQEFYSLPENAPRISDGKGML